jgi:ribose/xylose/arabinose/galactoside ABC-type transport system permease subunit
MSDLELPRRARRVWGANEAKLAVTILLVVVLTALADNQHNYWHDPWDSAHQVLRESVMLGIFALGSAVVIISGGIDLSTGSMIAFSASICAIIMLLIDPEGVQRGGLAASTIAIAAAGSLFVGFLVGSLHAWLITIIRLPPFVATLATLVGLRSLARILVENVTATYTERQNTQIFIFDDTFHNLGYLVRWPTLIFAVLSFLTWILLSRTVLGRHIMAMGGNEEAARLSGVRTDRLKWFAYCFSAMTASVAGVLSAADVSMASPQTQGMLAELNGIAAAVVGGSSLQGGIGTIPGVVLGAFFLRVVTDAVSKIIKGSANLYEGIVVGIVVVVAVAFSQVGKPGQRKQFFPGALGFVAAIVLALLAAALGSALGGRWTGRVLGVVVLLLALLLKTIENMRSRSGPTQPLPAE